MTLVNTFTKYIDTHLRVNTDLRTFLNQIQEFYNTHKHEKTPHMNINNLCNLSIMCLKEHVTSFNINEETKLFFKQIRYRI